MRKLCGAIIAATTCAAFGDVLTPAAPGDVKVLGRPGELFESSLNARVFSAYAQGAVYDEAENAFATHWDDSDGRVGWLDEYWGKTMLCYAGAVKYTHDAKLGEWCVQKAIRLSDCPAMATLKKHWPLKQLCGKDSEFIDEKNRRDCLMMSFIAAVHDRDAPFAACVLLRIRREVKMFSAKAEEKLVEKAFSSARFVSDYGESLFRETFDEEIKGVVSPDGYTRARMRTIRLAPFVLRPSTTLADAVQVLNKKALAADYVNNRKGVKIVLNADGEVTELPYVKVGEYGYGNAGVTLESAVKIVAEAVGYTFEICKDGTVVVFKVRGAEAMGESSRSLASGCFRAGVETGATNPPRLAWTGMNICFRDTVSGVAAKVPRVASEWMSFGDIKNGQNV